jgi:hypothetical protein
MLQSEENSLLVALDMALVRSIETFLVPQYI